MTAILYSRKVVCESFTMPVGYRTIARTRSGRRYCTVPYRTVIDRHDRWISLQA